MKRKFINWFLVLISTGVTLVVVEYCLKENGYLASVPIIDHKNEPIMQEFDPTLGWKNKPGVYTYPGYGSNKDGEIEVSILEDGARKTGLLNKPDSLDKLIFIGGSFTFGQAISDQETMAWKVQENFPSYKVLNWGVPAYGTYQSLQKLEQSLPQLKGEKIVFYGLLDHHAERNVATAVWLDILSSVGQRKHIDVPFVSVEEDHLERHEPLSYNRIPLGSSFAFTKLIERSLFNQRGAISETEKLKALALLIQEMNAFVEENGGELVVLGFNLPANYLKVVEEAKVKLLNYRWDLRDQSLSVEGEGHPSGKTNSFFASKIEAFLSNR